jgi:hypothetical protein
MIIVCSIIFLFSCVESGGTIIVENNYNAQKYITILSNASGEIETKYDDMYGPEIVSAKGTVSFNVKSNTRYSIFWGDNRQISSDNRKNVNVSGGETVTVKIP